MNEKPLIVYVCRFPSGNFVVFESIDALLFCNKGDTVGMTENGSLFLRPADGTAPIAIQRAIVATYP